VWHRDDGQLGRSGRPQQACLSMPFCRNRKFSEWQQRSSRPGVVATDFYVVGQSFPTCPGANQWLTKSDAVHTFQVSLPAPAFIGSPGDVTIPIGGSGPWWCPPLSSPSPSPGERNRSLAQGRAH